MNPQEFTTLPSSQPVISEAALEAFGDVVLPEIDKQASVLCFKHEDSTLFVNFNEQLDPSVASGLPIIAAYQAGFINQLNINSFFKVNL